MKTMLFTVVFCALLCGCQSGSYAPPSAISASDTATRWDSAGTTLRHFTGGFSTADGLTLFCQGWQPRDSVRAVVCLVHGLSEHSGRYARYAAQLAGSGFAVTSFDLRGHGHSMGQRGHFPSLDAALDDISLFANKTAALYPGKKIFLYGHSLGGNFVINYVLRRRAAFAGVIASAPFLKTTFEPPVWKTRLGSVMGVIWPTFSLPNGLAVEDATRDTAVQHSIRRDTLMQGRITARFLGLFAAGDWALAHANELHVPMLLMHGDADRITSERASALFAQGAGDLCTFKVWPGFFHQLHNEPGNEAVAAFVVAWMDSRMK